MMDFKEYLANDAMFCPCCEDNTLNSEGFNFDTLNTLSVEYSCDSCGAEWSENFTMTGLTVSNKGKQ
jgi:hypothetical protein